MPVIRNPFRRNIVPHYHSSPASPTNVSDPADPVVGGNGRERPVIDLHKTYSTVSFKSTSTISILRKTDDENTYKLSVVNDSGVYLPPSPIEKRNFWGRENSSSSFKNRPPVSPSDEQFIISRESFDSYRRSFDISARSPVSDTGPGRLSIEARQIKERASMDMHPTRAGLEAPTRSSLDSRPLVSSSPNQWLSPQLPPNVKDVEEPENEPEQAKSDDNPRPPKKSSIFSRFGHDHHVSKDTPRFKPSIFGRRDHHSEYEHESELNCINRSETIVI